MKDERSRRALVLLAACEHEERAAQLAALWDDGFDVECARSAVDCIRHVRHTTPAVIVMHRRLRDGDGWELARVLKSLSSTRKVPIVAIAPSDSHELIERALEVGCDAFLPKPFEPEELAREVRRVLDEARALEKQTRLPCLDTTFLRDVADDRITPAQRHTLLAHIARCRDCRELVLSLSRSRTESVDSLEEERVDRDDE